MNRLNVATRLAIAALCLVASLPAWPTGQPAERHDSPPRQPIQQAQDSRQAQAQGQSQTQGSQSLNDSDRSSYRSWAIVLPAAPWMPPMARVECASAQIDQSDQQVLWGAWRSAQAHTNTSDCTVIALRNAKVETCQYASAKQVEDLLLARHLPAFAASDSSGYIDLTPTQCAALRAPPAPALPVSLIQVPQSQRACTSASSAAARRAKARRPAARCS